MAHLQDRAALLITILALLLGACAPEDRIGFTAQKTPAAGETWTRPADQMDMVFVPSGEFAMGSTREMQQYAVKLCSRSSPTLAVATCQAAAFRDEQPVHTVQLESFWIDRTEVTNVQYQGCVEAKSCDPPADLSSFTRASYYRDPAYREHPVVNVLWQMASQYCAWAGARLPTEAEWEYAARGPESRLFPWGNAFESWRLNYCDAGCPLIADKSYSDRYPDTAPVGSFPSGVSWIGAMDLSGNVREWVSDWYGTYPADRISNPTGPETGELKVTRGGAWYDTPDDVRSANRGSESLEYYRDNLGFRCARSSG